MELRERIAGWVGWRTYGPAAGSAATHVVLLAAFASMMAASGGERMPPPKPPPAPPSLEVTLVAEALPPQGIRPTPPDPKRAPPKPPPEKSAPLPEAPPVEKRDRNQQKQQQAAAPAMTGGAKPDDEGGVYLGDAGLAQSGVPLGLRGLLEADPCNPKFGPKRGDCVTRWDKKIGMNPDLLTPSDEELKRMYPGLIPPCRYRVGCEGGEWISSIGTRSVFSPTGGPMMGGAGGQGGIGSVTGRLPLNPDHVDPGFGD
jgi:hypothetical protein